MAKGGCLNVVFISQKLAVVLVKGYDLRYFQLVRETNKGAKND
jgi:hypothetical protein